MPIFGALSKAAKAEIAAELEKTVETDGRIMKKKDMVEFEIEKRLGAGQTQADIMKALSSQDLKLDPNYIKQRLAVARRRNPLLKPDPNHRKMEANWIVEKGLTTGKTWDEISQELVTSGFNGPKITEMAKAKRAEQLNNGSPPAAVVDTGEVSAIEQRLAAAKQRARENPTADNRDEVAFVERLLQHEKDGRPADNTEFGSGPNAGPEQDGAYKGPVQDLKDLRKATDQEVLDALKKAGDEAHRRREERFKALREKGAHKNDGFDWSQLDDYYKNRITPSQSKTTENDTPPLDNQPLQPASEYANTSTDPTAPAEPVAQFPE